MDCWCGICEPCEIWLAEAGVFERILQAMREWKQERERATVWAAVGWAALLYLGRDKPTQDLTRNRREACSSEGPAPLAPTNERET